MRLGKSWLRRSTGLVILLSGILGSLIGGFAADAGHRSRMKRGILIGAVAAAVLSIPGAFFPLMPTATGFAVMLGLLALCGAVTGLVTATALAVLIPNEIRGVCLGAFMVVGSVIGLGIAPTMATGIADLLGGEAFLRYGLTITTAITSIIAAIGFAWVLRGEKA
jgi:MFS family permease